MLFHQLIHIVYVFKSLSGSFFWITNTSIFKCDDTFCKATYERLLSGKTEPRNGEIMIIHAEEML